MNVNKEVIDGIMNIIKGLDLKNNQEFMIALADEIDETIDEYLDFQEQIDNAVTAIVEQEKENLLDTISTRFQHAEYRRSVL